MLCELRVENLLLIEQATLDLAPGLNVITGETGAGKTVLAHALDLLLGGKAKPNIVRPGAREAYVEGVFALTDEVRAVAGDLLPEDAEELVLARRVSHEGRTRALLGGRTVTVADLQRVAGPLLSFYGQHEHRRLTLASAQLDILDAAVGDEQGARRAATAEAYRAWRSVCAEREALQEAAGARERELDLLRFELDEIDEVSPSEHEYHDLRAERDRARHVAGLRRAALGAAQAASPDEGDGGIIASLAAGEHALQAMDGVDDALDLLLARWRVLAVEADDLAAELRGYASGLDDDVADRLEGIEERLAAVERLVRKHGGSITSVLEHADRCRARYDELTGAETSLDALQALEAQAERSYTQAATALHDARAAAGPRLAAAVVEHLGALAMQGASFEVQLGARDPGPTGTDNVEFLVAPNAGVRAAPLKATASGGELSRIMLALMSVAHAGATETLVFDEIDAGIGGQTARAVGERLRTLADGRQVLCITHLPQVASLAARHFSIAKDPHADPAITTVTLLSDDAVTDELVRMLGADEDDRAAVTHAKRLRAVA